MNKKKIHQNPFKLNPPDINILNRHEFYVFVLAEKTSSGEPE